MKSSPYAHAIATPSPRDVLDKSTRNPSSGNAIVRIGSQLGHSVGHAHTGPGVHRCKCERYRPLTEDQAVALRLIRSVPAPLSVERVSRALEWRRDRAQRWLAFFVVKGVLEVTTKGHVWRDGR